MTSVSFPILVKLTRGDQVKQDDYHRENTARRREGEQVRKNKKKERARVRERKKMKERERHQMRSTGL